MKSFGKTVVGALIGATSVLAFLGLRRRFAAGGCDEQAGPDGGCGGGMRGGCHGRFGGWRRMHGGWRGWRHCDGKPGAEARRRFATRFVDYVLDRLRADDAQRVRVHALKDRVLDGAHRLHEEKRTAHRELLEVWEAEQADASRVRAVLDARIEALRGFAQEVADALVELHGVLTPAQRADVADHVRRRMA